MSFGTPEHPHWKAFVDGMETHLKGTDSPARWRWHPMDGTWYSYDASRFILDDVGLASTETPAELNWTPPDDPGQAFYRYGDFQLADAFRHIQTAYDGFKSKYPHAVWNPRSGDWRAAEKRIPGKEAGKGPSTSAQVRIAKIREAEAQGLITPAQATRLIEDVLAENG